MQTSTADQNFFINIISVEGSILNICVTIEFTVQEVKCKALKHFYGDEIELSSKFHLVHGTLLKHLNNEKTLKEEEISESDELLLVGVRSPVEQFDLSDEALKAPTEEDVMKATKWLSVKNPAILEVNYDSPEEFQNEICKILTTLVKASTKILMHRPDASKFYEIIKGKLEAQLQCCDDTTAIKTIVKMGYSEKKVLKALNLTSMNTSEALKWLYEHQDDDSDKDVDVESSLIDSLPNEHPGPSLACNESLNKEPSLIKIVNLLLDFFRQYRQINFKPDMNIVYALVHFGFREDRVIDTLKITGNNVGNAYSWLLGMNRNVQYYEGMDPNGPIYKAIMNNPQIQLSLTDPKMLIAYISILETYKSINDWLKDPKVAPVLSQIFNTYHAEKHSAEGVRCLQ